MIAGVRGTIESIGSNYVIIDIGGVSFQIFVSTSTLSALGEVGQQARLYTYLHVRDDNLTLYGFDSARELALFQTLITVKGIGPKVGLAMLSVMDADRLTMAVASGDATLLAGVPGIGKKTAERIVLELKDKVGGTLIMTQDLQSVQGNSEVVAALTSLGYSVSEATRAVATLPTSAHLSLEEKITISLKYFGGK